MLCNTGSGLWGDDALHHWLTLLSNVCFIHMHVLSSPLSLLHPPFLHSVFPSLNPSDILFLSFPYFLCFFPLPLSFHSSSVLPLCIIFSTLPPMPFLLPDFSLQSPLSFLSSTHPPSSLILISFPFFFFICELSSSISSSPSSVLPIFPASVPPSVPSPP